MNVICDNYIISRRHQSNGRDIEDFKFQGCLDDCDGHGYRNGSKNRCDVYSKELGLATKLDEIKYETQT